MRQFSRRQFVALAATGAAVVPFARSRGNAQGGNITALEVIDRIKKNVGIDWRSDTVDTFKIGDPATVVKGIVTTSLATMDVLRHAVKGAANLVITCGPTFYSRADSAAPPAGRGGAGSQGTPTQGPPPPSAPDPVFAAKADFIKNHNLVVWRFSDHWRLRKPDPLAQGLIEALDWLRFRVADDPTRVASERERATRAERGEGGPASEGIGGSGGAKPSGEQMTRVSIPATTLDALASDIKKKLDARGGIRVVGAPRTQVQTIGLLPGTTPIQAALKTFPSVDVIVAGEVREWESVEYARDAVTAGGRKGLILIGRVLSEEPGMNVCAQWLKTIVPEITTTWIRVGDPYWGPL